MKTAILSLMAASALTAHAFAAPPTKIKVASVRLNSIGRDGNLYSKVWLLGLDKQTLAAVKKVNTDITLVQHEIADAKDQEKLNQLQSRLQFLNQKVRILTQRPMRGSQRDAQALVREFIVATYKEKYPVIFREDAGTFGPRSGPASGDTMLWKGGVELIDITEEATTKLRERLEEISGGSVGALLYAGSISQYNAD